jgi:hypothetical protein
MKGVCGSNYLTKLKQLLIKIQGSLFENQEACFILHFSFFIFNSEKTNPCCCLLRIIYLQNHPYNRRKQNHLCCAGSTHHSFLKPYQYAKKKTVTG